MMRLCWIVLIVACQPLGDTTGELATHDGGQRVYWQMKLDDIGVKLDIDNNFDKRMPTKIHALRYMPPETTKDLTLTATRVDLNTVINVADVIFSWRDKRNHICTCHLHAVSLGAQRGIRGSGIDNATFCFEQKQEEGDYVRMLADHCVSASRDGGSRFIFLGGRDFACDLSKERNRSSVLQASCLAKGDKSCLEGDIRVCAEQSDGAFAPFIREFKSSVGTVCEEPKDDGTKNLKKCGDDTNTEDKYIITYKLKDEKSLCATPQPAEQTEEEESQ